LGDFIETKAKKSPTSPGFVSPEVEAADFSQISYKEEKSFLSLISLTRKENDRRGVHVA
jgi:hypothetical protein